MSLPSTLNLTPATAESSDAVAVTVALVTIREPAAGAVTVAAGGVVSGGRVVKLHACSAPSATPLAALIVAARCAVYVVWSERLKPGVKVAVNETGSYVTEPATADPSGLVSVNVEAVIVDV